MAGDGYAPPDGTTLVPSDTAGVGDRYADGAFTPPPLPPAPPAPPPVLPGSAILDALSPEQAAKADVRDLIRIGAAADVNTVKSKIRRVAAVAGTTPDALRAVAAS